MVRWPDLAEWRGPTVNQGPAMVEQRGLVVHIAEGFYEGTIAWQKKSGTSVSSHFVLAGPQDSPRGVPDGKLAQVVDLDVAAWTQRAGNGHWVSVECSGFTPNKLSAAQCESIAQLMARGHRDLGWPLTLAGNPDGKGLGFHSMGTPSNGWTGPTWGHEDCPGPNIIAQLPAILERAKQIVRGDDMPLSKEDVAAIWAYPVGRSGLTAVQVLQSTMGLAQDAAEFDAGELAQIAATVPVEKIAQAVVAALPEGSGGLTQADVEQAIRNVLGGLDNQG